MVLIRGQVDENLISYGEFRSPMSQSGDGEHSSNASKRLHWIVIYLARVHALVMHSFDLLQKFHLIITHYVSSDEIASVLKASKAQLRIITTSKMCSNGSETRSGDCVEE
jgi:hypothetical protein